MINIERTVDISGPVQAETLRGSEYTTEAYAHTFVVHVLDSGEPVTLTGDVSAYALLGNGASILIEGTISDGAAVVTLPPVCYEIPGRWQLTIYNEHTGTTTDKTCIYACVGNVINTVGNPQYDPGGIIPDAATLLAYIEACQTATTNANTAAAAAQALVDQWEVASVADTKTYLGID